MYLAYMNCVAYTTYGMLRQDWYIFCANFTGLCLAVFYSLVALTLLSKSSEKRDIDRVQIVIGVLVFGLFFFSILGMSASMIYNDRGPAATLFGMTGCVFSIMYYVAPLSTAMKVISTKDASSFYAPMICLNLANALLWLFYGFIAISQPAVWAPNMVGAALSIFQLFLTVIYRNPPASIGHKTLLDDTSAHVDKPIEAVEAKPVGQVLLVGGDMGAINPLHREGLDLEAATVDLHLVTSETNLVEAVHAPSYV